MTSAGGQEGPRRFVLLGDPVRHSVSPAMHAAAFRALGLAAAYRTRRVGTDGFVAALRKAAAGGGGGNVTLPHKERAADAVDAPTEAVRRSGACNCFWMHPDGRLAGDNTDVGGFLGAVGELEGAASAPGGADGREVQGDALRDARVLLLGAGGAARAVTVACLEAGVQRLEVLNRTVARARALEEAFGAGSRGVAALESARDAAGHYDLVVNATSLGLRAADPLPLRLEGRGVGSALDLVYGPRETSWVLHARRLGIPAVDGFPMLVRQAGLSLERWFPGIRAPLSVLREAAARTLGRAEG